MTESIRCWCLEIIMVVFCRFNLLLANLDFDSCTVAEMRRFWSYVKAVKSHLLNSRHRTEGPTLVLWQ